MLKKRAEKEVTPTTTESRCSRARSAGPPTLESNRIWERTQDKAKPHKSRDSFSNEGVTQDKARRHKRKKMVDEGRTTTHPTERQPQTRTTSNVCPHLRWCRRAMVRFPLTLKKQTVEWNRLFSLRFRTQTDMVFDCWQSEWFLVRRRRRRRGQWFCRT